MTTPRYLWHVTLDTGHGARSPRTAVDDAVVAAVGDNLRGALDAGDDRTPLVGPPGYTLRATSAQGALMATVYARRYAPLPPCVPLVTFAVATRARHASKLWRAMHVAGRVYETDPDVTPAPPYLAVRIEPSVVVDMGALAWLADYERCAAWAWIEGAAQR